MDDRVFLGLKDFTRTCELAADAGFELREAKYDGVNFGFWWIEVCRKGMRPRLVAWEARDGWMLVQSRAADGEWQDEWIVKDPTHDTPAEILSRLAELTK